MMSGYRVERDFLGTKEVPAEAYYGIQTLRSVDNFPITGYRIHPELIKSLGQVKKAAVIANVSIGRVDETIGDAITQAATEVTMGRWNEEFIVDPIQGGAGTSINMNANEVIANRAIEILGGNKGDYSLVSPNSHVNMSQSTNDAFPTAVRLALLSILGNLLPTMNALREAFRGKAQEFASVIKMGRTHLQDAVPIRLGQEFEAYEQVVVRDIRRITNVCRHLYRVNIGGTAVGTGLNADVEYTRRVIQVLADLSGFKLTHAENLIDATQNTDDYTEVSAALKICMINISKIANDLRLLASGPRAGLGEIRLPARQPGSSIMPGKVNPVLCEVVNQVYFQVSGNDHTICLASEAGQLELNVMEPVLFFNLLQSASIMNQTFKVFTDYCLTGIAANVETCLQYVDKSVGIITALTPHVGYEVAAEIAHEAITGNNSVRETCLRKGILSEEALNLIFDPYEMTTPGISGDTLLVQAK